MKLDRERRFELWCDSLKIFSDLRNIRIKKELSQAVVALRSGIDQSDISRLERGDFRNLTLKKLYSYVDAIGVKISMRIVE